MDNKILLFKHQNLLKSILKSLIQILIIYTYFLFYLKAWLVMVKVSLIDINFKNLKFNYNNCNIIL